VSALFDSGVVYAALDRRDAWHRRAVRLIAQLRRPPRLPASTLAEVSYLAHTMLGVEVELAFITDISNGTFVVEELTDDDVARAAEVMAEYPDVGFVDASIVATAERLRITAMATIDRRHFASIRPRHTAAFTLLP